jgi:CRISPR-associated endoribonuclease Cas6
MKYFELKCTAYLKKDIHFQESFEKLSKYISFSMAQDERLKTLHNKKGYKFYNFANFYPIEKTKIYKKGNTYHFVLRSPNEVFIHTLSKTLRENINNPNFLVVETHQKTINLFFITELYSVMPVIVRTDKGIFWTMQEDGDILKLQKQLQDNLEKKYFEFYKEKLEISQNFIQLLEIKNHKPQNIWTSKEGKSFRFFGNKFRILPNEDKVSQKLAFMALACGLGEKNSFGGGFCLGKGMR